MSANLAALCYLVAAALFILALRGLSNPETSRRGNFFGMLGMAIAIATTLGLHPPASYSAWGLVALGMTLGGGVNLPREPRNGRTFEYMGEDPLLAGILDGNVEKGVQSQFIIGDLKHYALNDQESGRNGQRQH